MDLVYVSQSQKACQPRRSVKRGSNPKVAKQSDLGLDRKEEKNDSDASNSSDVMSQKR